MRALLMNTGLEEFRQYQYKGEFPKGNFKYYLR
jgi:hypothetical protein